MSAVDGIFAVYLDKGSNAYGGERVNQLEHALQTAMLAEQSGADAALIVASLLHDYGHLIHNLGEGVARRGIDDRHEISGAEEVVRIFRRRSDDADQVARRGEALSMRDRSRVHEAALARARAGR